MAADVIYAAFVGLCLEKEQWNEYKEEGYCNDSFFTSRIPHTYVAATGDKDFLAFDMERPRCITPAAFLAEYRVVSFV